MWGVGGVAAVTFGAAMLLSHPGGAEAPAGVPALAACAERPEPIGGCELRVEPESFAELKAAADEIAPRLAADSPVDQLAAARTRGRLAVAPSRGVRGTGGRWRPVGKGPLHADDPGYPDTFGEGFGELAGRISDYAYDAEHDRLYAAVASGGVWASDDGGVHWRSIGNTLPTQTVGSVEYSPAAGGTLIAVTGDNAFGGNTYGGMGVYRSTDGGASWSRSRGVPGGAQGFKAAVDPTNPSVIYAATGAGLFRSADAGRSFRNVNLPTGAHCAGTTFRRPNCFFANIVTDVLVQAPDDFGNEGGAVLAVVGWRAGANPNFNGVPEAPGNGLYRSGSGRPGTFEGLDEDANGFAAQERVGRVEMGAATGPDQNHDYVYALVQDAVLFNSGTVEGLDVSGTEDAPIDPSATPTYFNGVYVSDDFGKTWTLMENAEELLLPTSGSTLAQLTPLGFGPGIQSWYDQWIGPDPTRELAGVPTRVVFGLEELYTNTQPTPQDGPSNFKTIGAYNANGGPCLLVLASEACSQGQTATQKTTTHPDQHAGIFIPDGSGGVTLVAGNDGGNYTQHTSASGDLSQDDWGLGDNRGFHTLLPYGAASARDGVVYAGLQDNGEMRIEPGGRQVAVYGGDGIFTVVDPANSDIVYEELPEAGISKSTDGGVSWTDIDPLVDNASFYAPLVMDPRNAKHLLSGGRQIVETTAGPHTASPGDLPPDPAHEWKTVFNLGKSKLGVENQASAIGVRGKRVYAGYCGGCDVVRDNVRFSSGVATNVGGKRKPKPGTRRGWHKVPARGLPQRFISSITVDPHRRRTIYVTLGASDLRPYAPPKAAGNSGISVRGGHVYKSTDGGRSFEDISGNLRRIPALWSTVRRHQLLVATTVGVFASKGVSGGHYALLGKTLPAAPVFQIQRVPGHPRRLLAASLGRGVYRYTFPGSGGG